MALELGPRFEAWLRTKLPMATDVRVDDVRSPAAGRSAETLLFTLHLADPVARSERLVLRCGPRGRGIFPVYDLGMQYGVMRALQSTPLPSPPVRWYEPDAAVLGTSFLIMDHVDGRTPSDDAPGFHGQGLFFEATEAQRAAMWRAGIEQLAALHALDWRTLDLPPLPGAATTVRESISGQATLLESWVRWGRIEDYDLVKRGMRWLRDTPPPTDRLALLWGDARPGNILWRGGKPAALLDWEIASIGVPEFDLYYWWWSAVMLAEVNGTPLLPGLPDKAGTVRLYEQAAGRDIAAVASYAETFAVLRLTIMCALGVRAAVSDYSEQYLLSNGPARALQAFLDRQHEEAA